MRSSSNLRLLFWLYPVVLAALSLGPISLDEAPPDSDKVGHYLAYGLFAWVGIHAYVGNKARAAALAFALLWGLLMEWGQYYVPGRDMSAADALANALGVASGAALAALALRRRAA